jgi:hypothetical protein
MNPNSRRDAIRFALPTAAALAFLLIGASPSKLAPRVANARAISAQNNAAIRADYTQISDTDSLCPRGTLPDEGVCVHLPIDDDNSDGIDAPINANVHRERSGAWTQYDQIPRRPDRPADYDAYIYPTPPGLAGGHSVVSGYDLDRPDDSQRRGRSLHAVGHGAVDLPNARGTKITMVPLEHQQGDADVVFVGNLFGTTVVTRHTVREAGQLRDYIVLFGHMDGVAPGVVVGQTLKKGDLVGFVGDTGSKELIHLHLETRRVRNGVDIKTRAQPDNGAGLLAADASIVCDPRNVLPLK